jgi:hypothetical protein
MILTSLTMQSGWIKDISTDTSMYARIKDIFSATLIYAWIKDISGDTRMNACNKSRMP